MRRGEEQEFTVRNGTNREIKRGGVVIWNVGDVDEDGLPILYPTDGRLWSESSEGDSEAKL